MFKSKLYWLGAVVAVAASSTGLWAAEKDLSGYEASLSRMFQTLDDRGVLGADVPVAFRVGKQLEAIDRQLAAKAYQGFGERFSASLDGRLRDVGAAMLGTARRLTLPGKQLEVLSSQTLDGKAFDWSTCKGKVVVIDFWATWCPRCLKKMPALEQAYGKYHDKGLEIVSISIDEDRLAAVSFQNRRALLYPVLHEAGGNNMATHYGIERVPTSILVDRSGKVIMVSDGGPELIQMLDSMFAAE